jgi:EF-P beta-lysylation protein EpmB
LQVLPLAAEDETHAGFSLDPLSEAGAQPAPGLVHKYRGRVLLITTPACGVHCRYCFRRHFPYDEALAEAPHWRAACEYIAAHPDIEEVILSGGDPLSLTEQRLQHLGERLTAIPHVRRLRIHTRMPVVLPSRVNDALLGWLADLPLQKIVVIHANHPREIDREVGHALRELATAQVTLLNQSVLLRGINDDAGTLSELSRTLFRYGVLPYYLHLLDRVQGAAHFEVDEARARALHAQLNANLPGYLLPRLVREQAGAPCKTPLSG